MEVRLHGGRRKRLCRSANVDRYHWWPPFFVEATVWINRHLTCHFRDQHFPKVGAFPNHRITVFGLWMYLRLNIMQSIRKSIYLSKDLDRLIYNFHFVKGILVICNTFKCAIFSKIRIQ